MTGTYTELFKAASPLRGGYPAAAVGGGTFGATAVADTILISTTLTSVSIFNITMWGTNFAASAPVITSISTNGMVLLTSPSVCSGSWLAIGY